MYDICEPGHSLVVGPFLCIFFSDGKNKDSIVKYFLLIFGVSVDLVNSVILKTPITWSFYLNSLETDAATKDGLEEFTSAVPYIDGDPTKGINTDQISLSMGYNPSKGVVGVVGSKIKSKSFKISFVLSCKTLLTFCPFV